MKITIKNAAESQARRMEKMKTDYQNIAQIKYLACSAAPSKTQPIITGRKAFHQSLREESSKGAQETRFCRPVTKSNMKLKQKVNFRLPPTVIPILRSHSSGPTQTDANSAWSVRQTNSSRLENRAKLAVDATCGLTQVDAIRLSRECADIPILLEQEYWDRRSPACNNYLPQQYSAPARLVRRVQHGY